MPTWALAAHRLLSTPRPHAACCSLQTSAPRGSWLGDARALMPRREREEVRGAGLGLAVWGRSVAAPRSLQLARGRRQVEDYLCQSLPYLEDSQASLREVAVRFLGEPHPRGPSVCNLLLGPAAPPSSKPCGCQGPDCLVQGLGFQKPRWGGQDSCSVPPSPRPPPPLPGYSTSLGSAPPKGRRVCREAGRAGGELCCGERAGEHQV